ncbi:YHS domain-containing (seleno)protein [Roseovarius sp.]|uniref:YHS domain-containing (seleno)protein n=1 Tax=Roseovarius sp. TaxID=1486281 RepID=UPI003BAAB4ED
MPTRRFFLIAAAAALLVLPRLARASEPEIYSVDGAAIGGYDPVTYFTEGAPVMGNPAHAVTWQGAEWRFSTAANRERFEANPGAYAPQYGGYCAYAASKGAVAPTAPDAWTVHDGKLYLNYSQEVRDIWSEDIPGNVARADATWPEPLTK